MPTKTFYNLPEEKKKTLLQAAINEFSKKSYDDASINQMIQESDISRGSFYMYFHDKEDLYFYLLGKFWRQSFRKLRTFLKENDGDLLQSFEDLYDSMIHLCSKGKNAAFFKNVFLNLRYTTEKNYHWTRLVRNGIVSHLSCSTISILINTISKRTKN